MSKKNIRLIMELIFIFILPLIFMCFTSEIQVERNFEYGNEGNYQISEETKKLSFDNSIIKYSKESNNYFLNDALSIHETLYGYTITLDITKMPNNITIDSQYINEGYKDILLYDNYDQYGFQLYYEKDGDNYTVAVYYYNYEDAYVYPSQWDDTVLYLYSSTDPNNLQKTSDFINATFNYIQLETPNTQQDFNEGLQVVDLNVIYKTETVNTIWGNIKNIVIDYLDVNDNVLLDILLCYLFLWFFMFLIWHTFYRFFDWIFHLSLVGGKDNG